MRNGRAAILPEMALRLEGWLGVENGGRADLWLTSKPPTTCGKQGKPDADCAAGHRDGRGDGLSIETRPGRAIPGNEAGRAKAGILSPVGAASHFKG